MNDKYNEIKERLIEAKEKYNNSTDISQYDTIVGKPLEEILTEKLIYPEEIIYFYGQKGELTFDILNRIHEEDLCSLLGIFCASVDCYEKDKFYNIDLTYEQLLEKAKEGNEFAQELLVCHVYFTTINPLEGFEKIQEYANDGWGFAIETLLHIYKKGWLETISPNPIKLKESCIKFNVPFDEESQKYDTSDLKKEYNNFHEVSEEILLNIAEGKNGFKQDINKLLHYQRCGIPAANRIVRRGILDGKYGFEKKSFEKNFEILTKMHFERLIFTPVAYSSFSFWSPSLSNHLLTSEKELEKMANDGNIFAQEILVCILIYASEYYIDIQKLKEYADKGWKYAICEFLKFLRWGCPASGIKEDHEMLKHYCEKFDIPFDEETKHYERDILWKDYQCEYH